MVQCTLGASVLTHHIDAILSAPFEHIGYHLPDGLSFVKLFQGRAYFNVSLMQWVYFDSTGYLPAATNQNIGGHQQEIEIDTTAHGGISKKLLKGWRTVRLMREMNHHKKAATSRVAKEAALAYDEQVFSCALCDPSLFIATSSGSPVPASGTAGSNVRWLPSPGCFRFVDRQFPYRSVARAGNNQQCGR